MDVRLRSGAALVGAIALATGAVGAPGLAKSPPPPAPPPARCVDHADTARVFRVPVDGQQAGGRIAFPSRPPTTLVVYAHGYGHTSMSWVGHLQESARRGVLAVAMDYRGQKWIPDDDDEDDLPSSRGWNAMTGAADIVAAARRWEAACPSIDTVVAFGVSMGGNMSGLAVAEAGANAAMKSSPKTDPLFDYWFDIEGAVNLIETYNEARAAAPASETAAGAQEDIEAETGGSFESDPEAYRKRTVVARGDDLAAAGLDGVVVVHAVNDGLVPYNQSLEMASVLRAEGIAFDHFTVTLRDSDSEKETTITGYVTDNVDPEYKAPLAGHASEKSETHIVMQLAFERLWALVEGEVPGPNRLFVANGDYGVLPPP